MKNEYEERLYQIIGGMLRDNRVSKGITLKEVSDITGLSIKTIQRYEMGERKMSIATFDAISSIYNLDYRNILSSANDKINMEMSDGRINRTYFKFSQLLNGVNCSISDISNYTGISIETFDKWSKGFYELNGEELKEIADYFGESITVFYDDEADIALSDEERLIKMFRQMEDETKQVFLEMAKFYAVRYKK